jgi:hypothetical protein
VFSEHCIHHAMCCPSPPSMPSVGTWKWHAQEPGGSSSSLKTIIMSWPGCLWHFDYTGVPPSMRPLHYTNTALHHGIAASIPMIWFKQGEKLPGVVIV